MVLLVGGGGVVTGLAAPTLPGPGEAPVGPRPLAPQPVVAATAVSIPAIGVHAQLVPLKLDLTGALQTPGDYRQAGWFTGGPVPGELGPSVIAGHVDSVAGPAVFFRLHRLQPGDTVTVHRSDGRAVVFTVEGVRRYAKKEFPTDAVYGPVPGAALRLITCGGSFDAAARSYRDNVVVFASVAPASR